MHKIHIYEGPQILKAVCSNVKADKKHIWCKSEALNAKKKPNFRKSNFRIIFRKRIRDHLGTQGNSAGGR